MDEGRRKGEGIHTISHTEKREAGEESPSTSRRTRTGGFVKTKARSFVESRSKGEEKEMLLQEEETEEERSEAKRWGRPGPFVVRRFPSNKPEKSDLLRSVLPHLRLRASSVSADQNPSNYGVPGKGSRARAGHNRANPATAGKKRAGETEREAE